MKHLLFQKPPLQEDVEIVLGLRKRRSAPLPVRVSGVRSRPFTITADQFGAPLVQALAHATSALRNHPHPPERQEHHGPDEREDDDGRSDGGGEAGAHDGEEACGEGVRAGRGRIEAVKVVERFSIKDRGFVVVLDPSPPSRPALGTLLKSGDRVYTVTGVEAYAIDNPPPPYGLLLGAEAPEVGADVELNPMPLERSVATFNPPPAIVRQCDREP